MERLPKTTELLVPSTSQGEAMPIFSQNVRDEIARLMLEADTLIAILSSSQQQNTTEDDAHKVDKPSQNTV